MMELSLVFVAAVAFAVFALGFWLTVPVRLWLRWLTRGTLGSVLFLLLSPEKAVEEVQKALETVLPVAASASEAPGADWVVHFFCFAALTALFFLARRDLAASPLFAGLVALGAVTEGLQILVEGRQAALGDFLADLAGVVIGYSVVVVIARALARTG
jgi:VanZ family protein